jgi:hypothetical protein
VRPLEYTRFLLPRPDAEAEVLVAKSRRARKRLAAHGHAETFLPLPSPHDPLLVLPLAHRNACAYAVEHWVPAETAKARLRNRVSRALLAAGAFPPVRPLLTLGTQEPGPPFLVAGSQAHGVPEHAEWFLLCGEGRAFRRAAFVVFPRGSRSPEWALKFAWERGDSSPFDRDERGLRLAEAAGTVVARHAPRLIGRFEVEGYQASVESAAVGTRLDRILGATNVSLARKLELVDRLAGWTLEVMAATVAPDDRPALPADAPAELVAQIASVPAVFQHNDLWTWHVLLEKGSFTVIDWEFASAAALPLWDLWYLLFDAATQIERVGGGEERLRFFTRLFRGDEPLSRPVLEWTRRAVERLSIPPEAVGPLASLVWLQYGSIYAERLGARHLADPQAPPIGRLLPEIWFREPGLGPEWDAWRA